MLLGLERYVHAWEGKQVTVVGDVMLDVFLRTVDTGRKDPSTGVPVYQIENRLEQPGGAANAAMNLAAMGADVSLVGITGYHDHAAMRLHGLVNQAGVKDFTVKSTSRSTNCKIRYSTNTRAQQVDRMRIDSEATTPPDAAEATQLLERVEDCLDSAVLLSDYGQGTICSSVAESVEEWSRDWDAYVHLDPHRELLPTLFNRGISCVTPNTREAMGFANQYTEQWPALVDRNCTTVITRGEDGANVHRPGDWAGVVIGTKPVEYPKVCGAGDTFAAALLLARLAGAGWEDAVTLANAAGRAAVLKPFTSVVNSEELLHELPEVLIAQGRH
jgi:D-beta-D-heptose 7-phosphate kinase/D-beta-D-heptose 1-phosphate adenosyltransferase